MTTHVTQELRELEAAARQRRDYHHRQFDQALNSLKALGARCPGVACPKVKAAGLALSKTTRGEVHAPFMAFADALRTYARTEPENDQGEGVTRLANQAMAHMRELAHHIDHEVAAPRELQLFAHLHKQARQPLDETPQPRGPGI